MDCTDTPSLSQDNPLSCPVVATMNLISGKWKPMLIHALSQNPMRFGELKRALIPISQKVLTQQLKELERDRLIEREVFEGNVITVTYSLSKRGETLKPVIDALYEWGELNASILSGTYDKRDIKQPSKRP